MDPQTSNKYPRQRLSNISKFDAGLCFSFNFDVVTFGKTSKFIAGVIKIKGIAFAARARACTKKHPKGFQTTLENGAKNDTKVTKKTSQTTLPQTVSKWHQKGTPGAPKDAPRATLECPPCPSLGVCLVVLVVLVFSRSFFASLSFSFSFSLSSSAPGSGSKFTRKRGPEGPEMTPKRHLEASGASPGTPWGPRRP